MPNSIGLQADLNPRQQFAKKQARFMYGDVRKMECLEGYNKMFLPHLLSRTDFIIPSTFLFNKVLVKYKIFKWDKNEISSELFILNLSMLILISECKEGARYVTFVLF